MDTILTRDIFRLGELGGTGDGFVLAGTSLETVRLTTRESADGASFLTTGEAATFAIDGTTILTRAPEFREIRLETNLGRLDGVVFQAGSTAYFIPELPAAALVNASQVAASSPLLDPVRSIDTAVVNLDVPGATTFNFTGTQLRVGTNGFQPDEQNISNSITTTVTDADGIRNNGPETGLNSFLRDFFEVEATFLLTNGRQITVDGIQDNRAGSFGSFTRVFHLDQESLAAQGATQEDIARFVSSRQSSNDLTLQELGFSNAGPVETNITVLPDLGITAPTNEDPIAQEDRYTIRARGTLTVDAENDDQQHILQPV